MTTEEALAVAIAVEYPVTSRFVLDLLRECGGDAALTRRALDAGIGAGAVRLAHEMLATARDKVTP